jgi:hypothetical protein
LIHQSRRIAETNAIAEELERILVSPDFDAPPRGRALLRFLVEETLAGRGDALTTLAVAQRVFGRGEDHDAAVDPIVRIRAGSLRRSLESYYRRSGALDPVEIAVPRETTVVFSSRQATGQGPLPDRTRATLSAQSARPTGISARR